MATPLEASFGTYSVFFLIYAKIYAGFSKISEWPLGGSSFAEHYLLAISNERVLVPSFKIVINLPRTISCRVKETISVQRLARYFGTDSDR